MNETLLMKIITGLCIVSFLFMYVFSKFNLKFTKDSFKGFKSFNEFNNYFKYSYYILIKHKLLLFFPILFIFINEIIRLLHYVRLEINVFDKFSFPDYQINYYSLIIQSINDLDYGFYDYVNFYTADFSITIILIVSLLRKHIHLRNKWTILFISIVFIFLFYNIISLLSLFQFERIKNFISNGFFQNSHYILQILNIILKSYLETFLLVYFSFSYKGYKHDLNLLIKEITKKVKYLILINFIINCPALIDSIVLRYFKVNKNLIDFDNIFNSIYYTYLQPFSLFLQISLFLVPIIIIQQDLKLVKAILVNFRFIISNLVKYLTFMIVGILLFVIYELLDGLMVNSIGYYPYLEIILVLKLFLAVIFYIAFFKFYIDSQPKANQNSIV